MIATMVVPFVFNLWFRKLLDVFELTGGILHICLFIVFIVVLIVLGPKNDSDFVFKTLVSDVSGWNNPGVSWGLGLLTVTFSVSGETNHQQTGHAPANDVSQATTVCST